MPEGVRNLTQDLPTEVGWALDDFVARAREAFAISLPYRRHAP